MHISYELRTKILERTSANVVIIGVSPEEGQVFTHPIWECTMSQDELTQYALVVAADWNEQVGAGMIQVAIIGQTLTTPAQV